MSASGDFRGELDVLVHLVFCLNSNIRKDRVMAKKMVVFCGSDEPEKAYPPFMLAAGALASDMEVMLFFTMSGLNIVKKGGAENITLPNAPMSLSDFIETTKEQGVRLVACSAAFPIMNLQKEDIMDGVAMGGVATFLNEAKDADIILTF
jgi:predicted peroxiredoxin